MSSAPIGARTHQTRSLVLSIIAILGFVLPIAAYFWFIHQYSLNIIAGDQWDDVRLISHSYNGTLDLNTLWASHNENRIFFPNLIVLLLSRSTHFNILFEEYFSGVMLIVAMGLIVYAHKRRSPSTPWIYYCPIAILMLSFVQYQNALWGFQLAWYLVLLSFAVAIVLLDRMSLTRLALAGATAAAIVGSLSSLQGLLIWPAGLVLLYSRRRSTTVMVVWLGCAAATGIVYFSGQHGTNPYPYLTIQHPMSAVKFFLFAIGDVVGINFSTFAQRNDAVIFFGLVIFLMAICVLILVGLPRDESDGAPIGVALICFGLLFAALITEGRLVLGLDGASASRYTTFDLLVLVGCYMALLGRPTVGMRTDESIVPTSAGRLASEPIARSRPGYPAVTLWVIRGVVVAAIYVQFAVGINTGLAGGRFDEAHQVLVARVMVNFRKASNSLVSVTAPLSLSAIEIRQLANVAASHRLSLFSDSGLVDHYVREGLPGETPPRTTVIYPPNGFISKGTQTVVASASGEYGVTKVQFQISGGRLTDLLIGTAAMSTYGWYLTWNTTMVPNGTYILHSAAYGATGRMGRSKGIAVLVAN